MSVLKPKSEGSGVPESHNSMSGDSRMDEEHKKPCSVNSCFGQVLLLVHARLGY